MKNAEHCYRTRKNRAFPHTNIHNKHTHQHIHEMNYGCVLGVSKTVFKYTCLDVDTNKI